MMTIVEVYSTPTYREWIDHTGTRHRVEVGRRLTLERQSRYDMPLLRLKIPHKAVVSGSTLLIIKEGIHRDRPPHPAVRAEIKSRPITESMPFGPFIDSTHYSIPADYLTHASILSWFGIESVHVPAPT
jgi:hypothetical protein